MPYIASTVARTGQEERAQHTRAPNRRLDHLLSRILALMQPSISFSHSSTTCDRAAFAGRAALGTRRGADQRSQVRPRRQRRRERLLQRRLAARDGEQRQQGGRPSSLGRGVGAGAATAATVARRRDQGRYRPALHRQGGRAGARRRRAVLGAARRAGAHAAAPDAPRLDRFVRRCQRDRPGEGGLQQCLARSRSSALFSAERAPTASSVRRRRVCVRQRRVGGERRGCDRG
eukprot:6211888-Pleurochrysis_carterae.AAC.1